jgi:hypothetical protein
MRIAKTLQCLNAPAKSNIPMLSALTNQPTVKRLLFICPLSISSSQDFPPCPLLSDKSAYQRGAKNISVRPFLRQMSWSAHCFYFTPCPFGN